MLYWALMFLVVALIAAALGFGGIAGAAGGIAKILFFLFLVFFVISLFAGLVATHRVVGLPGVRTDCPLDIEGNRSRFFSPGRAYRLRTRCGVLKPRRAVFRRYSSAVTI